MAAMGKTLDELRRVVGEIVECVTKHVALIDPPESANLLRVARDRSVAVKEYFENDFAAVAC